MALHDGSPPPAEEPAAATELEAGGVGRHISSTTCGNAMLIVSLRYFSKSLLQMMSRTALAASRWQMTMRAQAARPLTQAATTWRTKLKTRSA